MSAIFGIYRIAARMTSRCMSGRIGSAGSAIQRGQGHFRRQGGQRQCRRHQRGRAWSTGVIQGLWIVVKEIRVQGVGGESAKRGRQVDGSPNLVYFFRVYSTGLLEGFLFLQTRLSFPVSLTPAT